MRNLLIFVIITLLLLTVINMLTPTGYIVLKQFTCPRCSMGWVCVNESSAYRFANCNIAIAKQCNNGCFAGWCLG